MIYFIEAVGAGLMKIGFTDRPVADRVRELQAASPHRLRIVGTSDGGLKEEAELHERFAHLRQNGEWFTINTELVVVAITSAFRVRLKAVEGTVSNITHPNSQISIPVVWDAIRKLANEISRINPLFRLGFTGPESRACPECGAIADENRVICDRCGLVLIEPDEPELCSRCGGPATIPCGDGGGQECDCEDRLESEPGAAMSAVIDEAFRGQLPAPRDLDTFRDAHRIYVFRAGPGKWFTRNGPGLVPVSYDPRVPAKPSGG